MVKKVYLADLLHDEMEFWERRKILIVAPTGMGKTTFVLDKLLPYLAEKNKKMLILCNRKMLRKQYWYDVIQRFDTYSALINCVEIRTYQELSEEIRRGDIPVYQFKEFDCVVCDEAHYFYADASFNGAGTYQLLYGICAAGYKKTLIFMSATMDEVEPLIQEALSRVAEYFNLEDNHLYNEFRKYDYTKYANYDRFAVSCVPNLESLAYTIARTDGKSIIFIDNKTKAEKIQNDILKISRNDKSGVEIITSENLESQDKRLVVETLTLVHRVKPQVLITTSVLDNGVSIHDKDVKNVAIIADSKISFLQMLGRIRVESVEEKVNLILVEREVEEFEIREKACEEIIKKVDSWENGELVFEDEKIIFDILDRRRNGYIEFCEKMFVICKRQWRCLLERAINRMDFSNRVVTSKMQSIYFFLNEFAYEKMCRDLLDYGKMKIWALDNPRRVIEEQMRWIGKNIDELIVCEDEYKKILNAEFVEELLTVKKFTKAEMMVFKKNISSKYMRILFPDRGIKLGESFADKKFESIIAEYGFMLKVDIVDGLKKYTVVRGEAYE